MSTFCTLESDTTSFFIYKKKRVNDLAVCPEAKND